MTSAASRPLCSHCDAHVCERDGCRCACHSPLVEIQPASAASHVERCEFGCCEWAEDGTVIQYSPHPPDCRYCLDDAVGVDALGRPACERHIEEVADDLGQ